MTDSEAEGVHPQATWAIASAALLGVTRFVIAPGSRSAPLTVAAAQHPDIQTYVVPDERSAGHVALGMAQHADRPIGLICTSGTAAANFLPAIIEAHYQQLPLLVFTADRSAEWIDQEDNQAIRQQGLYGSYVRAQFTLAQQDGRHDTAWFARRVVSDAVHVAMSEPHGPVHINAPFHEPLYSDHAAPMDAKLRPPVVAPTLRELQPGYWDTLLETWKRAKRILIVGGMHPPQPAISDALGALADDPRVVVVGDITSNLGPASMRLPQWDLALFSHDKRVVEALEPDLVITFGGQVTSKNLKRLLRASDSATLLRVGLSLPAADTYQRLAQILAVSPLDFFQQLAHRIETSAQIRGTYRAQWSAQHKLASRRLQGYLGAAPFGEFVAIRRVWASLPPSTDLQIGNSMPIRYANYLGATESMRTVHSNRGASGIDGTVSTAVGAAIASGRPTTLIVGDMAFFYDRNGLWHSHVPPNLRVVLLNNHGGGIFDLIDGPETLTPDLRSEFFLTPHPLTARNTASDFGMDYVHAADLATLESHLKGFWSDRTRAAILEIDSDMATNSSVFRDFRALMQGLTLASITESG